MTKRILVVSACLMALIGVLVFPAGAAGFDYNDYVTNITVDGDNDIVTVVIPAVEQTVAYSAAGATFVEGVNGKISFPVTGEVNYDLRLYPFPDYLDLSNIPDGTTFTMGFHCYLNSGGYDTPTLILAYDYYSNGSYISGSINNLGKQNVEDVHYYTGTVLRPTPTANQMGCSMYLYGFVPFNSGTVTFKAMDFVMTMTISSLYRLQQQSGKTNEILTEVEKQLADQGKTLDDVLGEQQETNDKLDEIINGTVDPSAPAGSGTVGDLDDTEAGLRDDAQSGLDQGLEVQQSALDIVLQYASAFACVGWIFNKFADLPFFSGLLYVSMALGIYGTILGVGLSASRTGSRAGGRSGKGKGG